MTVADRRLLDRQQVILSRRPVRLDGWCGDPPVVSAARLWVLSGAKTYPSDLQEPDLRLGARNGEVVNSDLVAVASRVIGLGRRVMRLDADQSD